MSEEKEQSTPKPRNIRWFIMELCEDERDRISSPRSIGFLLAIVSIILLILSLILPPISTVVASRCFEAFKYLLAGTGPVVVLLTAGQIKSAVNGLANAAGQNKSNITNVTNVTTKTEDGGKRDRKATVTPKAATTTPTPAQPPGGGRVQ